MMQRIIRLFHHASVRLLVDFWRGRNPDLVVSLVPNLNRAMFESLEKAVPGTPFVTILTDLADYPPHFWIEEQSQYLVCGTDRAVEQAFALGHDRARVFRTSGMILRPAFYGESKVLREHERERLGLKPDLPTGIVLFGGEGSNVMYSIAERLGNCHLDLQLILICGRNERLKQRLHRLRTRNGMFVEGFTKEIPYYMFLSDFFIGKPGPGSISEALHMGLPVIVESNAWTLPQERFNAEWVQENKVGVVLRNFRGIKHAVERVLKSGKLEQMRDRIRQMNNRAVFEIPPILEEILAAHVKNPVDSKNRLSLR
jgi:1,2-diacylglycerol 3-beta-galactosyltransferase